MKITFGMLILGVTDIYSKYFCFVPLKDKTRITITSAFENILNESDHKPNNIRVGQGSEFYKRSMKSWLHGSGVEMYSTHNKGKSVITERFIRTLKT